MNTYISKSQYLKGSQCQKAFWYLHNRKDLKPVIDAATQERFDVGKEVGELAQQCFPGGVLIEAKPWEFAESAQKTKEIIENGAETIYEAAALAPNGAAYARADILTKESEGWHLIEVKSSTSVKDYHYVDTTLQYYAFTQAGYDIKKCSLMHINKEYTRQGEIDPKELFEIVDITDELVLRQADIPDHLDELTHIVKLPDEPEVKIGSHCTDPYDCDYKHHCWKEVPTFSVFNVLYGKKAEEVADITGSYDPVDIPDEHIPSGAKAKDVKSYKEGKSHIEPEKIKGFLDSLIFPLHYVDYETIGPAIPMFDNTQPYKPVPFQFSHHLEESPEDTLKHRQFLHWHPNDPREEFIEALIEMCGDEGSVVVYNKSFEAGCNTKLAEAFPEHKEALMKINDRMVDLYLPFKNRWVYHPNQNGSASIKAVLPAFTEISYEELEIAEGAEASRQYLQLLKGNLSEEEKTKLFSDLTAYCEQDTWAMTRLIKVLRGYV